MRPGVRRVPRPLQRRRAARSGSRSPGSGSASDGRTVADKIRGQLEASILVFIDAHYALALAAAGDREAADGCGRRSPPARPPAREPRRRSPPRPAARFAKGWSPTVPATGPPGRTLGAAPRAARADRRQPRAARSFTQILVDAAARAGRLPLACAILSECTAARPGQPLVPGSARRVGARSGVANGMRSWQNPFAPQHPYTNLNHLEDSHERPRRFDHARFRQPRARRAVLAPRLPRRPAPPPASRSPPAR